MTICLTRLREDRCATLKLCLISRQKYAGSRSTEYNGPANASTDWLANPRSRHSFLMHIFVYVTPNDQGMTIVAAAYIIVISMFSLDDRKHLYSGQTPWNERISTVQQAANPRTCAPWRCHSRKTFSTADRPWASDNVVPLLHQHSKPMWVSASKMLTCHPKPLLCIANRCRSRH